MGKCIPTHNLKEHTFVLTRKQAVDKLDHLLNNHKHVRYMWIPYEDAVVVVTNDPTTEPTTGPTTSVQEKDRFQPLVKLLMALKPHEKDTFQSMGFGDLRDSILHSSDVLNVENVKQCNKAEAQFWKLSEGYTVKPSDQLLQFDCGGQQWVYEVCFPTGTLQQNNGNDMQFMYDLLNSIETSNIPAPAPIEQRWSASSSSYMSPAFDSKREKIFSWVGVIMYLPNQIEGDENNLSERNNVTQVFRNKYCPIVNHVGKKYNAVSHWAKLEMPQTDEELKELHQSLKQKYPVELFNLVRFITDPMNLLSNDIVNISFGSPSDHTFLNFL